MGALILAAIWIQLELLTLEMEQFIRLILTLTTDSSEDSGPTSNGIEQKAQDETNTPPPPVPRAANIAEEGVQQRHGHGNDETKAKSISEDAMDSSGEASGAIVERGHDANGVSDR
ncbi:hypothetical protein MPER_04557 [Moniliophthora perniciosa FA553]|nr:hypothetical protein MPER_04557 [Moniliophthora perniciosa FA553]